MSHPSAAQRHALSHCRPLRCTLRPGETLLLPAYWHHEVYSRPAAAGDGEAEGGAAAPLNVAVNFWFRNETAPPASF
jgi:hypothetical protein